MDTQAVPQPQRPNGHRKLPRKGGPAAKLLVALIVVIIGAAIAVSALVMARSTAPDSNRYQAVFLNNGQVFFGRLKNTSGTYLRLEKAYYTQKQNLPDSATTEQKAATANNVSLIKVGDEVYGPEGNMNIRADQVLFWQNLKTDSKVAKAIDSAK